MGDNNCDEKMTSNCGNLQKRRPCARGAPRSMKRSTIAGGSRRGSGSGFHWCEKPEEETDLRCTKAPQAVATLKQERECEHEEKNLQGLASPLRHPKSLIKRQDMELLYKRCCGLDIHKKMLVACLIIVTADGKRHKEIRSFRTVTQEA